MDIFRYTAFSAEPSGGNPAGVVLDATGARAEEMQAVAAQVGFSETAFLVPTGPGRFDVRYYSPLDEVAFCGHATIAAAVAWAEHHEPGPLVFDTRNGPVPVDTARQDGRTTATLTSVEPRVGPISDADLAELLAALGWARDDLDPHLPPRIAWAGVSHPIVATGAERLADLDYDFARLAALMAARQWTTVDLVHRERPDLVHARNPFPPGGVVEDPATGAAAAALGGYLRELGLVETPARVTVLQGAHMGRPGTLVVDVAPTGGIRVTGTAVSID